MQVRLLQPAKVLGARPHLRLARQLAGDGAAGCLDFIEELWAAHSLASGIRDFNNHLRLGVGWISDDDMEIVIGNACAP